MIVLHRLRHIDDVSVSVVIPADSRNTSNTPKGPQEVYFERVNSQHVELAEVGVDESSLLKHLPHVLHDLQVELPSLRLRK